MTPEVGVFKSMLDAGPRHGERVERQVQPREKINLLTPASTDSQIAAVEASDTEQPGMGEAIGTVVGGALGVAGGLTAGAALASLMVPGVGPIMAGGLLGAGVLGLTGATGGAAAGHRARGRSYRTARETSCMFMKTHCAVAGSVMIVAPERRQRAHALASGRRVDRRGRGVDRCGARTLVDRTPQRRGGELHLLRRQVRGGGALLSKRLRSSPIDGDARKVFRGGAGLPDPPV